MSIENETAETTSRKPGRLAVVACATLGTVLYTASFHPFDIAEFAYLWALPWLALVSGKPSRKSLWWSGFLLFWIGWLVLIPWLRHVHWAAWILLSAWSAVFPALWLVLARDLLPAAGEVRLGRRLGGLFAVASAWVLLEWVRTTLFTGWGWLPLASSQWQRPAMLQILPWTGQWGLSFVLMLVNTGLFLHGRNLWRRLKGRSGVWRFGAEFYVSMAAMLGCFSLFFKDGPLTPTREPFLKVGIVQPAILAGEKWEPESRQRINETLVAMTRAAAALPIKPDVILWPEAGTPDPFRYNGDALPWVEALAAQTGVSLLSGAITWDEPEGGKRVLKSGIGAVSPTRGMAPEFAAKRHLVPFGEYVPLRPIFGWLDQFVPIGTFTPGEKTVLLPIETGPKENRIQLKVGALVCYEDAFGQIGRENALAGADLHFVVTNNAWYGEEWGAKQHALHSALRAAETRRPVVRCGNAGWSGWFDEYGAMRAELTRPGAREYFKGVESVAMDRDERWIGVTTFYVRHGDWLVSVCAFLTLAGLWRVWRGGASKTSQP